VGIKNLSRRQFFYHCASGDEAAPMKMSLREEQSIAWWPHHAIPRRHDAIYHRKAMIDLTLACKAASACPRCGL